MSRLEDIRLIAEVTVFHRRKAFDRLVKKYQSPIRRFFLSQTLGDVSLSDDLAQDTFIKAYTHITQYQAKAAFLTWLYRIAYNVFYDYVRRQKETVALEDVKIDLPTSRTDNDTLRMDLYDALNILSPPERMCVTLQLMEGQSVESITQITGIGENTVKSHLSRGKKKMADYLRNNGYQ